MFFLQMFFFYIEISREVKGITRNYNWATDGPEIPDRPAAKAQNCIYSPISLHSTTWCMYTCFYLKPQQLHLHVSYQIPRILQSNTIHRI